MCAADVRVTITAAPSIARHVDEQLITAAVRAAVAVAGQDIVSDPERVNLDVHDLETGVRLTDDAEMRQLNREYRGVDRPTDVLSFAFAETTGCAGSSGPAVNMPPDWPLQLGDILVSWQYAGRQAAELGHSIETEIAWLTIHGTLQLLGYHHDTESRAEHMEDLERNALERLGLIVE